MRNQNCLADMAREVLDVYLEKHPETNEKEIIAHQEYIKRRVEECGCLKCKAKKLGGRILRV